MSNSNLNRAAATLLGLCFLGAAPAQQTTTSVTRTVSYDYDANGRLIRETVEPNTVSLRLITEYGRDPTYGVVTRRTLKWLDPATGIDQTRIVEATGYDARRRYPAVVTNAKSQSQKQVYDEASGQLLDATDPNQLSTTWQYDVWGRTLREDRPDQTATTWAYRGCVDACNNGASQVTIVQQWAVVAGVDQRTTVPQETFSDRLGREVFTRRWNYAGEPIYGDQIYDPQGRLQSVARAHTASQRSSGQVGWTRYLRDDLGRPTSIETTAQSGSGFDTTTITYDAWRVTTVNPLLQSRTEISNALGLTADVIDATNNTTRYRYEPFGNLASVTDPLGNPIRITYDPLGRKTQLADPDLGTWTYQVNPLGLAWRQRDAKLQETTFTFDELNRLVRRLEPDQDSRWEYDTAIKGVGRIAEVYTMAGTSKDYQRIHSYDGLGRPRQTITRLDWDYTRTTAYDRFSRPATLTHTRNPKGGTGGASVAFGLSYNNQGQTFQVFHEGVVLWSNQAQDAQGRRSLEAFGSGLRTSRTFNPYTGRVAGIVTGPPSSPASHQNDGYDFDPLGNLRARQFLGATAGAQIGEVFGYDALNRLTRAQVSGQPPQSFGYDAIGNLTAKSNVGSLSYPPPGAARPHAVSAIGGSVAGLTDPSFSYDANGNLSQGLGRAYVWSAANQPVAIERIASGAAVERTEFVYAPERERLRQVRRTLSGPAPAVSHTLHYGGAIEKEIVLAANQTRIRTYLPEGLGYVEEVIAGTDLAPAAAAVRSVRFFQRDRQGSLIAISDGSAQVLQRFGYDAWGRRRHADGSDDAWSGLGTLRNTQDYTGYSGQEQLDPLGLVHLNGRVYDPISARLTSADPTASDPAEPQALNRYSYALNQPLRYVDPSGLTPVRNEDEYAGPRPEECLTGSRICRPASEGPLPGMKIIGSVFSNSRSVDSAVPSAAGVNSRVNRAQALVDVAKQVGQALLPTGEEISVLTGVGAAALAEPTPLGEMGFAGVALGVGIRGVMRAGDVLIDAVRGVAKGAGLVDDAARAVPVGSLRSPMEVLGPQNVPTTIGGRQYTGHALDQMQGRGIMHRSLKTLWREA